MNTLNDRTTFTFSGQDVTGHDAGMYPYFLYRNSNELIFAGNFYYNGTDTSITFDVSDIITSDISVIKEDNFNTTASLQNKLVNKYLLQIVWDEEDYVNSSSKWIAKVYNYPNKYLGSNTVFFTPDTTLASNRLSILLQGYTYPNITSNGLIPHYPIYNDEQMNSQNICPFGISFLTGNSVTGITASFVIDGNTYGESASYQHDFTIPTSGNSFSYLSRIGEVSHYQDLAPMNNGKLKIQYGSEVHSYYVLQIFDSQDTSTTYLYRRYQEGDTTGTYQYAFVLINNSTNKSLSDTSVDITSIDTSNIIYATSVTPVGSDILYSASTGTGTEYVVNNTATKDVTVPKTCTAAIFDVCPKRYYLFWQDRFGSFQCQGFNNHAKYTESYDKTEVQDYQNRRRNANVRVQSKWKLNSGWIPEELYPYYESIYISPILILFDTEQNKKFTVIISGDYEEKTFKNQKKMINMNLELTENKVQNIIY